MMNANTGPSYLFNMLRSGARQLGQASLGPSRHSINEISGQTGQTPLTSLELNLEGPGADSHHHPTPSTITDIAVKGMEVEGRTASSNYLPDILQTGDGDPETTSHHTTTHTEERGSGRSDMPVDRFAPSQTGRRQTRSDPEPAIGRPEPETSAVSAPFSGPAASSSDLIPLQQERSDHGAEIERDPAYPRSAQAPAFAESAPLSRPEAEPPPGADKSLSEIEQSRRRPGGRVYRVVEEYPDTTRKGAEIIKLQVEAYPSGVFAETASPDAPVNSAAGGAGAGQSPPSGASPVSTQPATTQAPRTPRLISATDLPITTLSYEARMEPASNSRALSQSSADPSLSSNPTQEGGKGQAERIKEHSIPPSKAAPDEAREMAFNEALRRHATASRQESAPKLTIHRLEVQVINQSGQSGQNVQSGQVSQSSADHAWRASPAPSFDERETLERRHLGRLL
jgi:hypothetical protein